MNTVGLFDRGRTWFGVRGDVNENYGPTQQIEGRTRTFNDSENVQAFTAVDKIGSGQEVVCRVLRNVGATALDGGTVVKATPGLNRFRRTEGPTDAADQEAIGIVDDEYGVDSIRQHDLGYVVVSGPVVAKKVNGDALTAGDKLIANDAGQVIVRPGGEAPTTQHLENTIAEVLVDAPAGTDTVAVYVIRRSNG